MSVVRDALGGWSQTIGSFLTIYCVLPCMSVMHDALGKDWGSHIPLSTWAMMYYGGSGAIIDWDMGSLTQAQTIGNLALNAESTLQRSIAPHQGSILGPPGLWEGALGSRHLSTHGYYFIIVHFILNAHYLLCPTLYACDA